MKIKSGLLLLLLLIIFSPKLYAGKATENSFSNNNFVKDVQDALLSSSNEVLVAKTAGYLRDKEKSKTPNCFECSLYLIKSTLDSPADTQLVAADLAVKFSPDLPEARLHFISRLMRFAPFKVNRITNEAKELIKTFFCFPPRDAFFYSLLDRIRTVCLTFLLIYFFIILLKYPSLIAHRYMHLVGHSKFYAVSVFFVVMVSSWILFQNNQNFMLVVLTFLVFLTGVALLREKIILYFAFILCLMAEGGIILAGANEDPSVNRFLAMNHLNAIYSPSSSSMDKIDVSLPGGSLAKGFMFFYLENYNRAVFHLKKELAVINDGEIKISIQNTLGISLAAMGNYKEATEHLKSAYESSKSIHVGYNLAKVLFEGGMVEEATRFENNLLSSAGSVTLTYPHIELPKMYKIWRYVSSGKTHDRFENRVRFVLFLLGNLFFYMLLLLVRLNYLKGLTLTRCLECGTVMCSKCNAGGQHVCAVCKLMKANPDIFVKGEKEKYEIKRERYFARHSIYTTLFTFIVPGGGLIFSNRIIEGSLYLFSITFIIIMFCQSEIGLVFNIRIDNSSTMLFFSIITASIIYLISIVRGFLVSRGD